MIRAIVRHSLGGSDRWIVELDHARELSSHFRVNIRGLGEIDYGEAPTHAEAITLAHELLARHSRS